MPNERYKLIDCDLSDYYLLRITNTNDIDKITDSETGHITLKYICSPGEHIVDFSINLLGIYKPEHIFLEFTSEGKARYMHYCSPTTNVEPPEFDRHYCRNEDKYFWCMAINRIHQVVFDYSYGTEILQTTCVVTHTPMLWNFWHFSLHWQTNMGLLDKLGPKAQKTTAQKIGHSVRSILSLLAKVGSPENALLLPSDCYSKQI
ncbi:MAG: hypothetical protein ABIQ00_01130 [Chitinophagaceae bacterium]